MLPDIALLLESTIIPPYVLYPRHHYVHRQLRVNNLFLLAACRLPDRRWTDPDEGRATVVSLTGCYFFRFFLISYYSKSVFLLNFLVPWNESGGCLTTNQGDSASPGDRPQRVLLVLQRVPCPSHTLRNLPYFVHIQFLPPLQGTTLPTAYYQVVLVGCFLQRRDELLRSHLPDLRS